MMQYGIEEVMNHASEMGLSLGQFAFLQATTPKRETKKRGARTRRQKKIDSVVEKMRAEGAEGKEISKAVWRELNSTNPDYGYHNISRDKKAEIRQALQESEELDKLILDTTDDMIEEMEIDIEYDITHYEAVNEIARLNFLPYFGLELPRNDYFQCLFIKGNDAWYSMDLKTGYYRYFTRDSETGVTYGLNFFDVMEIAYGYDFLHARKHITRSLKILYKEGEWEMMQELKYLQAMTIVEKAETTIKKDFPELYKYIKRFLPVMQKLLNIGITSIRGKDWSVDDESVFYSSSSFIADYQADAFKDMDRTTVNRAVNIFSTLGLLKKEKEEDVPHQLLQRAKMRSGEYANFNTINFYTIPMFDHLLLKQANERVIKLREHKVASKEVSRKKVVEVFGEEYAQKVYGDEKIRNSTTKVESNYVEDEDYPF